MRNSDDGPADAALADGEEEDEKESLRGMGEVRGKAKGEREGTGWPLLSTQSLSPGPRLKAASRSPRLDLSSLATASSTSHSSSNPPSRACVATCGQNPRDQPTRSCPRKATPDKPRYAQSDFSGADGPQMEIVLSIAFQGYMNPHVPFMSANHGTTAPLISSFGPHYSQRILRGSCKSIQPAIARRHQIYFASPPLHAFCRRVLREA